MRTQLVADRPPPPHATSGPVDTVFTTVYPHSHVHIEALALAPSDHVTAGAAEVAAAEVAAAESASGVCRADGGRAEGLAQARRVRSVWWYGLGVLWLLDALLQAQPIMFTANGLAGTAVLPAAQGQPGWIAAPMLWGLSVWQGHPAEWNTVAVGLELAIGGLVLVGRRWPTCGRAGLLLSIGWGLVVWYFGEGLGGLFSGSPTFLAGAPGAALLYVVLAAALLLPETVWTSPRLMRYFQVGVGALWLLGGVFQLAPLYWSPLGLASVLQSVAMMPLPFGLSTLDARLVASLARAPVLWNAALSLLLVLPAGALLLGRMRRKMCLVALGGLLFIWVVFQGCGMVFSDMATDPNTPLLWALMLVPSWIGMQPLSWRKQALPACLARPAAVDAPNS